MTKEIKKLLELAAKACGHTIVWGEKFNVGGEVLDCTDMPYIKSTSPDESDVYWVPHLDDGDGARMEAELKLSVAWSEKFVFVYNASSEAKYLEGFSSHNGNRQAARRMASLRVAAEVARRMK